MMENADLSYGQLQRKLKEEMLKMQGILEAIGRREQVSSALI